MLFNKTLHLIEFIFLEVFTLAEWVFKVGTRLLILYLLYDLALGDLLDKILNALG